MAVNLWPFKDNRVREAFRLIVDRPALIEGALAGFGTPANDLWGHGLPFFAHDLPVRTRDVEKAKSLLKAAGQEGLKVTLYTSSIDAGFTEAATLFAQQALAAGVHVNVKLEPPSSYFNTALIYTHLNFAQSLWNGNSLATWYTEALLSSAVWNETHFRYKWYDNMIYAAEGAPTARRATELWHKVQEVQYNQGGYVGWANEHIIDAAQKYVKGIVPSAFYDLGGPNYRDIWLNK
jgi:peptide/nickel transport system substrate-binding protein